MASKELLNVPNALSLLRLILVALVWIAALAGQRILVAIGIAIAGATDVADGIVARSTGTSTRFGSQLDSIADISLMASTLAWLIILRPTFLLENWLLIAIWLGVAVLTLAVGWVRFRKVADLHLYSAKAAATVSYAFVIYLLFADSYERWMVYTVFAVCLLATAEALVVFATSRGNGDPIRYGCILPPFLGSIRR
ncbi:MAG: CDP-alcohol phosphatidyltransferase family protein [Longimicrobiales bacterium]